MDWKTAAGAISPLLAFAGGTRVGGEDGILGKIFSLVETTSGFAVEFGEPSLKSGTVAALIVERGWGVLYMDQRAPEQVLVQPASNGQQVTLARERVSPSSINDLFAKYQVPGRFDCLVIDIDGPDYWVWKSLDPRYSPSLVVAEYNANVALGVEASIAMDDDWAYRSSKDYGASFSALCALATSKGYRLIHVHGSWNLYFLREDIAFPAELTIDPELSQDQFDVLTDTVGFYDALWEPGRRPSWFAAPAPDVSRHPWALLAAAAATRRVDVEGLVIDVLADKVDGNWYLQRKAYEEKASLLYQFIRDEDFTVFVDVGANSGFISMLARQAAPELTIIAIEADPRLAQLIQTSFAANGLRPPTIVNAIAGDQCLATAQFSLNPSGTLDNRVRMSQWEQINVPMVSVDHVLHDHRSARTFFKIDTQGFELQVLRGMEDSLAHAGWILKMEFAPDWLASQGTDPLALLDHLQSRYEFAEFPERIAFGTPGIGAMFATPIRRDQHARFLAYVKSLNRAGRGWVDLIVRPRATTPIQQVRD